MTAEVAILNRGAVALAADSATTVTYYEGGREQHRYFKGANKIFNISKTFPVGLMIYNAADLQGMPWEVIAKGYRESRGQNPHDTLHGYATDFFDFIVSDGHLFPPSYQEQQLVSQIVDAFQRVCFVIQYHNSATPPLTDEQVRKNFDLFLDAVNGGTFIGDLSQDFITKHSEPLFDQVMAAVADASVFTDLEGKIDPKEIFHTAVTALFSHLMREHSRPLRDVIGMLPIDELAELAETLISIESLKERVTRPSQSVSGPVDVAVISKIDGFIWIKRKHYFDAKLNPRFFSRKGLPS